MGTDPNADEAREVDLSAFTAALPPDDQLKARVPAPVVRRAEQLYELLLSRTRDVRKGNLIAALVQAAPTDPDELVSLVRAYEDARVHETLVGQRRRTGTIRLPRRRSGRPEL